MRKRILWVLACFLLAFVLLLVSCTPATTTKTEAATTVQGTVIQPSSSPITTKPTVSPTTSATAVSNKPKYGGTVTFITGADTQGVDDAYASAGRAWTVMNTNEQLWEGDWTRGPAGTGEVTWFITGFESYYANYAIGCLAQSWDISGAANDTLTLHLRKGIPWQNKPPTNGREMTSDDVLFTFQREFSTPTAFIFQTSFKPVSMTAPDKYTVVIRWASFSNLAFSLLQVCDLMVIWPRDAVTAHNNDMRDWHNVVGTGAFMFSDYVKGSSITMERNPNYWQTDPIGPGKGSQLPYVDQIKFLIIPDISTQTAAAMRTGKADHGTFLSDMAATLIKTNPELLQAKSLNLAQPAIVMRLDNPSFPWTNVKVRQAMFMAVDYKAISDSFYLGNAEWYSFPAPNIPESKDFFTPINQLPANVQDLFKFQPDKAKQMLADAGYAKGFDFEVVCKTVDVDLLSIYKSYLSKIGINLIIDARDTTVFTSITNARTQKQGAFLFGNMNVPFQMVDFVGDQYHNADFLNDPKLNQAHDDIWSTLDWNKRCQTFKAVTPYILENCFQIPSPANYQFTLWQPWLKNYHGELSVGNNDKWSFAKYLWSDQDLKQKSTGSR